MWLRDERGHCLDVASRKGEAREQRFGQLGALLVMADEMSVGERRRLADVVQQGGEPQQLIVRIHRGSTVERRQRVAPQVVAGDLVLRHAALCRELGQGVVQHAGLGEDRKGPRGRIGPDHLAQLVADSLGRHPLRRLGRGRHRRQRLRLDLEAQLSGQTCCAQEAKRILVKSNLRLADSA